MGVVDDVGGFVDPGAMIRAQNALTVESGRGDVRAGLVTRVEVVSGVEAGGGGEAGGVETGSPRRVRVTTEEGDAFVGSAAVVTGGVHRVLVRSSGLSRDEANRADDDDAAREPGRELGAGARARLEAYRPSRGGDRGDGEGAGGASHGVVPVRAGAEGRRGIVAVQERGDVSVSSYPRYGTPTECWAWNPGGT